MLERVWGFFMHLLVLTSMSFNYYGVSLRYAPGRAIRLSRTSGTASIPHAASSNRYTICLNHGIRR